MRVARSGRRRGVPVSETLGSSLHRAQLADVPFTGFFLITTDILGPYGVGFAMGTLGWGPGEATRTSPSGTRWHGWLIYTQGLRSIRSSVSWPATLDT
jgi:hypothetical protein